MLIHCLIDRAGDTVITRGGVNYVFRQNRQGHAVCEVQNDDHARIFLRMGPTIYRPYGAQAEMHARAMKMLPKQTVIEEDEEVFEERVGITEGREAENALHDGDSSADEVFPEMESAEEAAEQGLFAASVDTKSLEEIQEDIPADPLHDPVVIGAAQRVLKESGTKKTAAEQLQKQFGLSSAEAKQIVDEVSKR